MMRLKWLNAVHVCVLMFSILLSEVTYARKSDLGDVKFNGYKRDNSDNGRDSLVDHRAINTIYRI